MDWGTGALLFGGTFVGLALIVGVGMRLFYHGRIVSPDYLVEDGDGNMKPISSGPKGPRIAKGW